MEPYPINYIDDVAIVKIDLAAATLRDSQALWDKMAENSLLEKQKVIIDLSYCTFVDSTYIGMIVKIFKRINENSGTLKLVFPQITDLESFRVIGITKILECFNSVADAFESFKSGSSASKISIDQNNLYYNL